GARLLALPDSARVEPDQAIVQAASLVERVCEKRVEEEHCGDQPGQTEGREESLPRASGKQDREERDDERQGDGGDGDPAGIVGIPPRRPVVAVVVLTRDVEREVDARTSAEEALPGQRE